MGAGHSHHQDRHGDDDSATPLPVRRFLAGAVGALVIATVVGLVVLWPSGDALVDTSALGFADRVDGRVVSAEVADCSYDPSLLCDVVAVSILPVDSDYVTLEFPITDNPVPAATLRPGDDIVLNDAGPDVPREIRYSFADYQRGTPLLVLAGLFVAAVVALGRWRGVLALAGLALSIAVLVGFILPALLRGSSPVGVAVTGASAIALGALYLAHGVGERTTVAVLGTMASLGLTALLASLSAGATELTGLASEESINLLAFAPDLDFRGLLLAAVIIGALGVLDDVTVTQTSAVWELHRADPSTPPRALYASAIRIGRDHIASTVNTLVLAYAAAALPLLLLYTQSGLVAGDILTSETLGVEIVQTLVGSIGLVASVPITTALATWVVTRREATTAPG